MRKRNKSGNQIDGDTVDDTQKIRSCRSFPNNETHNLLRNTRIFITRRR